MRSKDLERQIESLYETISTLKCIGTYTFSCMDITKIVLIVKKNYYRQGVIDGYILSKRLRNDFGIQSEYDKKTMVLLMKSFCNDSTDFEALKSALIQLDHSLVEEINVFLIAEKTQEYSESQLASNETIHCEAIDYELVYQAITSKDTYTMCSYDAVRQLNILVTKDDSIGRVSAEYVIPYPPGIPILVPGELIHKETLKLFPSEKTHIKVLK